MKQFMVWVFVLMVGLVFGAPQYAYGPPNYQSPGLISGISHGPALDIRGSGSQFVGGSSGVSSHIGHGISSNVGGNFGSHSEQHAVGSQQAIVTKQFFIHSAPEEQDEIGGDKVVNLGPVRKHYRVVFIKAPHQNIQGGKVKFLAPSNEEKTVIYVLSKKTDLADIAADVQQAQSEPTKPEVHFIKYKTQEEAIHAQRTIQAQYDQLGGTSQVSDEGVAPVQSVIGVLGDSANDIDGGGIGSAIGNAGNIVQGSNSIGIAGSSISNGIGDSTGTYLPPSY
ncbi:uncharacterized protein LOC129613884 [Condylostylus longicornis]|uniref:uncharacterized protein LOC129613884 n=1 Tax=Condylostylus longicornis TaxID=2530218 RepID=UPI00244DE6FF|nr:uncharacterized protein LOC129613884 [Condylostylus longicornis]